MSLSEFPLNSTISKVGSADGGNGNGFRGDNVVVKQSKIKRGRN